MSTPIISVRNIGKKYHLGFTHWNDTLRDKIAEGFRRMVQGAKGTAGSEELLKNPKTNLVDNSNELWALRDVSFDVQQGEVVGVIGRNGAGKSTLLKILSEITEPTEGEIRIRGRISSLLEVGTGFHPELSGRENIFMNGAILGMTKSEIKTKFDEIVSFAEVEKFIDTPVKRYSSGMYVRLAFAVAAHMEPEILLIDEVLAVGDVEFQNKCLGKMQDVSKGGRTIIFVSHNMGAVERLCDRTIVLRDGKIYFEGNTSDAISVYLRKKERKTNEADVDISDYPDRDSFKDIARFQRITLKNKSGHITNEFKMGEKIVIELEVKFTQEIKSPIFDLVIVNSRGQYLSLLRSRWEGFEYYNCYGIVRVKTEIENLMLTPGSYFISPQVIRSIEEGCCLDIVHLPVSFNVLNNDITGYNSYMSWDAHSTFCMHIPAKWVALD